MLNSKLIAFWLKYKGKMQGDNYQIDKEPLLALPIILPSEEKQAELAGFVTMIIDNKQKEWDYTDLLKHAKVQNNFEREILINKELEHIKTEIVTTENKIDSAVYALYDLSDRDIATINNEIK